jgi:hypothetical protein
VDFEKKWPVPGVSSPVQGLKPPASKENRCVWCATVAASAIGEVGIVLESLGALAWSQAARRRVAASTGEAVRNMGTSEFWVRKGLEGSTIYFADHRLAGCATRARDNAQPYGRSRAALRRLGGLATFVAATRKGVAEEARTRGFAAPAFAACAYVDVWWLR